MTTTIKLQPLFLRSLDAQIRDHGGDGWNCGVKVIRDITKDCASVVYQIQNDVYVEAENAIDVAWVHRKKETCWVEYCVEELLYKAHTVVNEGGSKTLKNTIVLGHTAQEARAKLIPLYDEGEINFRKCFDDPLASLVEYVERWAA